MGQVNLSENARRGLLGFVLEAFFVWTALINAQ